MLKGRGKGRGSKRPPAPPGSVSGSGTGLVLGGADYVEIMMGSRRREREEAVKLPRDPPCGE
jgi:hypothetical protein